MEVDMDDDDYHMEIPPEEYNMGTIKVVLKLFDTYHEVYMDWSEEEQGYLKSQIFNQIATITGIPTQYTTDLKLLDDTAGEEQDLTIHNPAAYISVYTRSDYYIEPVCNEFVASLAQHETDHPDNQFYHLAFRMWLEEDKHFYIYYELVPRLEHTDTQCSRLICIYAQQPVILDRFRSLILDDVLYAKMCVTLPDDLDDEPEFRDDVLIDLNVFQYYCMPCASVSDPLGHFYLRGRG